MLPNAAMCHPERRAKPVVEVLRGAAIANEQNQGVLAHRWDLLRMTNSFSDKCYIPLYCIMNATLRQKAIVYPSWIPLSLRLSRFCSLRLRFDPQKFGCVEKKYITWPQGIVRSTSLRMTRSRFAWRITIFFIRFLIGPSKEIGSSITKVHPDWGEIMASVSDS